MQFCPEMLFQSMLVYEVSSVNLKKTKHLFLVLVILQ